MTGALIGLAGAVVTGVLSLIGVYISNRKSASLMEYRLEQLEKKVDLHNSVIERTYKLEEQTALLDAEDKRINKRLEILEDDRK